MERRRRSQRLLYESDDESKKEANCIARRLRKNVTHVQKEEEEEEEEEDKKEEVNSGFLHVTCGTKKGILDVRKLEKRQACIQCEGRLLTPNAFELFGGKGHFKKWKASVFYNDKPLNFWLEQGYLLPNGYQRPGTAEHVMEPPGDTHSEGLSIKSEELSEEDDVHKSSESENIKDEHLGEADRNEEEMKNGDVSWDQALTAANSADNENPQGSERTPIICTNIVKVVLQRLSEDLHLHQIKGSVRQEEEEEEEEEPNSSDTPLSAAETDDLSINGNNNRNNKDVPVAYVSCEPLKESFRHAEEQEDPSAADKDRSKTAITDSSLVEEDGHEPIKGNDSAENLEEIPPTTFPCDSSPAEHMEPHTSEKEVRISDVEKNEALGLSTKSSVELETSSPTENPIIISSELKMLQLNICIDQTSVGDRSTHMEEDSMANATESVNIKGMDLDQLKKEKIKMQLKVLRLQEEYYKLKIRKLKE